MKGNLRIIADYIEGRLKDIQLQRGKISKEKIFALGYTVGVAELLLTLFKRGPD